MYDKYDKMSDEFDAQKEIAKQLERIADAFECFIYPFKHLQETTAETIDKLKKERDTYKHDAEYYQTALTVEKSK